MLAEPSTKDCRKNYRLFRRFGGNVIKFCDLKKHWNKIKESDVFVDGIYPYEATNAILKGVFNIDVPIGSRFS